MTFVDKLCYAPDNEVHGADMGPTWGLSAPDGPHVGPMNLAIRGGYVNLVDTSKSRVLGIFDGHGI